MFKVSVKSDIRSEGLNKKIQYNSFCEESELLGVQKGNRENYPEKALTRRNKETWIKPAPTGLRTAGPMGDIVKKNLMLVIEGSNQRLGQ